MHYKELSEVGMEQISSYGRKAYFLSQASHHGFTTPEGYAISVSRDATTAADSKQMRALANEMCHKWDAASFVVRSSTAWEDGSSESAAGQFLTKLACIGTDAIVSAIGEVTEQARDYAIDQGLQGEHIGILLQPMVEGAHSGVCFTSHWEYQSELILEYTTGPCHLIVEGCDSSQREHFSHVDLAKEKPDASEGFLWRVARGCWELREKFGFDLDIEWTVTPDNQLVILQVRPITGKGHEEDKRIAWKTELAKLQGVTEPKDLLTSLSIGEVFGFPKPLFKDLLDEALTTLHGPLSETFGKFGFKYRATKTPCFVLFCTRPFINLSAYARSLGLNIRFTQRQDPRDPIGWRIAPWSCATWFRLARALVRFPSLRRTYLKTADQRLENLGSLTKHDDVPFSTRWMRAKKDLLKKYIPLHLEADILSGVGQELLIKMLTLFCRDKSQAIRIHESLAFGPTNPNIETNLDLFRLGTRKLTWEEFVKRQGDRGQPDWDLSARRFRETPDKVRQLALTTLRANESPVDKEWRRKRKGRLLDFFLQKHWWYRLLRPFLKDEAQLVYYREKSQHVLYRQIGLLRQLVLQQSQESKISKELVFFLHERELLSLPEQSTMLLAKARERRKRHRLHRSIAVPVICLAESPEATQKETTDDSKILTGLAISQGSYAGRAYVAASLEEALQMPEGDILVVSQIDPAWSAVLYLAGAIVCEQGGLFCHSSILIRELGVPAVVNLPGITQAIQTGDALVVNGTDGIVAR